jgi:hypothetical protein
MLASFEAQIQHMHALVRAKKATSVIFTMYGISGPFLDIEVTPWSELDFQQTKRRLRQLNQQLAGCRAEICQTLSNA